MSKDLHFQEIATVQMPYPVFKKLKDEEQYEEMRLLSLKDISIDYSKNKEWREANKTLKEAIIHRKEIEEKIRVEKHLK